MVLSVSQWLEKKTDDAQKNYESQVKKLAELKLEKGPLWKYRQLLKDMQILLEHVQDGIFESMEGFSVFSEVERKTQALEKNIYDSMIETDTTIKSREMEEKSLPTTWRLPVLDEERHLERSDLFRKIEQSFSREGEGTTICFGLPGSGKTEAILYYAYHASRLYSLRVYFDASSEMTLKKNYRDFCAEYLDLKVEALSDTQIFQKIQEWVREHPGCLFIFANAAIPRLPLDKRMCYTLPQMYK